MVGLISAVFKLFSTGCPSSSLQSVHIHMYPTVQNIFASHIENLSLRDMAMRQIIWGFAEIGSS
jgi:hypothetical protein